MSNEEKLELAKELEQYTKEEMIEKYIDELEENLVLSDLWCKSQEELKESKAREEEHQRLNGELREEIERLKQEHEAIKKYVHNHTITYMDNGIECCKPDEYFNISWVEDMLNGNFENLDVLFEDSEDNG